MLVQRGQQEESILGEGPSCCSEKGIMSSSSMQGLCTPFLKTLGLAAFLEGAFWEVEDTSRDSFRAGWAGWVWTWVGYDPLVLLLALLIGFISSSKGSFFTYFLWRLPTLVTLVVTGYSSFSSFSSSTSSTSFSFCPWRSTRLALILSCPLGYLVY